MKSRSVAVLLLLAACGSSGNANSGESDDPPPARARFVPLQGVDVSELNPSETRAFQHIVEGMNSPCGQAMSLDRCVRENVSCASCVPAARYTARLLSSGYSMEDARDLVKYRYAADTAVEVSVDGCVWKGNPAARVTIVEFADFECPHCKLAHEMFDDLFEEMQFGSSVRLCYRFFPLDSIHQNARPAAVAAVAAGNQGKFWQMHDLLYDHQTELTPAKYIAFATELGLDLTRFRADLELPATAERVQRDRAEGDRLEIEGTPWFYVNGRRYGESIDPDSFKAYVSEELAR